MLNNKPCIRLLLAVTILASVSNAIAQGVDFDKQFPLSEEDLYDPIVIGENGELPSERTFNKHSTYSALDYGLPTVEEENIKTTTAKIKDIAATAKSFNIADLPKTSGSKQLNFTQQGIENLEEAEQSVAAMEQTIESIIQQSMEEDEGASTNQQGARPLVDFPNLTEKSYADVASYGLYTKETGGYSENIWQNVSRETVENYFNKVKKTEKIHSHVIKEQLRKLLLTRGNAPQGEYETNWLATRISMLHHLNEAGQAGLLISSAGIGVDNVNQYKGMPQVWVENALMHGKTQTVCPFVKQNILNSDGAFWRQALLACQALMQDKKGLELSSNMTTEKMRRTDPLFYALLDVIQGQGTAPMLKPAQKLTPLHSVLYAQNKTLLAPNVIPLLPDVVLRRIAKDVTLPLSIRLQSAEVLVNNFEYLDDLALLSLLYDKVEFDEKVVTSPGIDRFAEEEVDGSLARALLWQGAKVSGLPSTRALTLKALWERAERDNLPRLASRLKPELRGIHADSNLAWISPEVIARSLRYGDIETAKKWWSTLKLNRSLSRELMERRNALQLPFAFIDGSLENKVFEEWIKSKSFYDETDRQDIQKMLTFLEAEELSFPADIWQKLHETTANNVKDSHEGFDMGPLWLRLLGTNLEGQKVAVSFMLLSEPLLAQNMSNLGVQTAGNVVTGFNFLGMPNVAKALIFESLFAQVE